MQNGNPVSEQLLDDLDGVAREDLIKMVLKLREVGVKSQAGGVGLHFHGKDVAMEMAKRVRPRVMRTVQELCVGDEAAQANNLILEGDNLQGLVTLYKYRGQVDLIVTDPPYNTGQFFRYNDKWDEDPNDPEPGHVVKLDDGSRHTKWMKAMIPRLHMMKAMLKPGGVIAMCIDDNELFHLGVLMDEVFEEANRIAILNWQKSYAPKNDSKHVSTATEYVLVYSKDKEFAKTGLLARDDAMNAKYKNPDGDPEGLWRDDNPSVATPSEKDRYAIQSPFTGALHYPGARAWAHPKKKMREWLEAWGVPYVEKALGDDRPKALVIQGAPTPPILQKENLDDQPVVQSEEVFDDPVIAAARAKAEFKRDHEVWPLLYFSAGGFGRPAIKRYLQQVKKGKVPLTYWADEEYEEPLALGVQSWEHQESGHSQAGVKELDSVMGKGHGFQTVKPLRLIKKIIQLWCPPNGLVLDPYAGSGTTAHAVLELNKEAGTHRRFVLIEQGSPERGDLYARSLTAERVRRAVLGLRPDAAGELQQTAEPLGGGFAFRTLGQPLDWQAVEEMSREEVIDLVIAAHCERERGRSMALLRAANAEFKYLFARNEQQQGYFLIWDGERVGSFDVEGFAAIHQEALRAGLKPPYHVYARYEVYQTKSVRFYKFPDILLEHLGVREAFVWN